MALQDIINISNSININRRKVVGVQITRSEIARTSVTPTKNPWRFTVAANASLQYARARKIIEGIDTLDRYTPETISFSQGGMSWMFAYQGALSLSQLNTIELVSFVGNQLVLDVQSVNAASSAVVFAAGDFIQLQGYPYPFTSTTDVLRGTGDTITVTTHRPNIFTTTPAAGTKIVVGNAVQFRVFCKNMPTPTLKPGGYILGSGASTSNAMIEWSDNFELFEWLAEV